MLQSVIQGTGPEPAEARGAPLVAELLGLDFHAPDGHLFVGLLD